MKDTCINTDSVKPIYQQIAEHLRKVVNETGLRPGQLVGSECDFAKKHGVSRVSVRKAVDKLVEEGVVERRPGKGVFVMNGVTTKVVQMISPNLAQDQSVLIARGAKLFGLQYGLQIQVYDAHGNLDSDIEMLKNLPNSGVSGAIITQLAHKKFAEAVYYLMLQEFPFVLVDGSIEGIDVPSISTDNYGAGYIVGQKLIESGHTRIAFLGNLIADTVRRRMSGLRDAMNDAQLPFMRSLMVNLQVSDPLGDWSEEIDNAIRKLMEMPEKPTAIFCSCDAVAARCYMAIRSMGLSIPNDISIVGFDGDSAARYLDPSLATIRQSSEDIGRKAAEILFDLINDKKVPTNKLELPGEWVPGGSIKQI